MGRKKIIRHVFRLHGFRDSLQFAAKGVLYLFLYHRNMRLIFLAGLIATIAGLFFQLTALEWAILCITITIVFVAEIFNTAIEMLMGMLKVKYYIRIKLIKDIAAAVVLLASINAIIVGCIFFINRISR